MSTITAIVSAYYAEKYMKSRMDNLTGLEVMPEIIVICQEASGEHRIALDYPCTILTTPDIPTVPAAWNMGIEAATGDYLTSANADDTFYPGGLSAMAEHLDNHDCAVVCGDCDLKIGSRITPWKRRNGAPVGVNFNSVGAMPLWRKSVHAKYGMFEPELVAAFDYEFWVRLLVQGEKFCQLNQAVGVYLRRPDSREHREPIVIANECRVIRERYRKK